MPVNRSASASAEAFWPTLQLGPYKGTVKCASCTNVATYEVSFGYSKQLVRCCMACLFRLTGLIKEEHKRYMHGGEPGWEPREAAEVEAQAKREKRRERRRLRKQRQSSESPSSPASRSSSGSSSTRTARSGVGGSRRSSR